MGLCLNKRSGASAWKPVSGSPLITMREVSLASTRNAGALEKGRHPTFGSLIIGKPIRRWANKRQMTD